MITLDWLICFHLFLLAVPDSIMTRIYDLNTKLNQMIVQLEFL